MMGCTSSKTVVATYAQKPTRRARKPTYRYTFKLCRAGRGNLRDSSAHVEHCRVKGTLARKGAFEIEAQGALER